MENNGRWNFQNPYANARKQPDLMRQLNNKGHPSVVIQKMLSKELLRRATARKEALEAQSKISFSLPFNAKGNASLELEYPQTNWAAILLLKSVCEGQTLVGVAAVKRLIKLHAFQYGYNIQILDCAQRLLKTLMHREGS